MDRLPIIYIRGFAGSTATIDGQVDDPFYGFNAGATHVRVGGDGDPMFYQFEGPMLRLMTDEGYHLLVHGDQKAYLLDAEPGRVPRASLWVYRFYDQVATTFTKATHTGLFGILHRLVTADGFDIETAAEGLYQLIELVLLKTGAPKVFLVAHSMGGLVARCMMQKICEGKNHRRACEIVAKLCMYGTPNGGIQFEAGALNWVEETFGPVGSDIFAPRKMYGYLTPGARFGDEPPGADWDPRIVDEQVFSPADIFCIIGTDPKDYGVSRVAVGPKSDGLVLIRNAYVRKSHRAYIFKSHSGRYGEVNSEEGYQNLRRFLFGRWAVSVTLDGLPDYPRDMDQSPDHQRWPVWQADMRLAIRGLPVVISEQLAAHWCPIQLNHELSARIDTPDTPVPLVSTFLIDPAHEREAATDRSVSPVVPRHASRMRYTLTLRVFKLVERGGGLRFGEHLEQVPDWADSLIVDVGPSSTGGGLTAWAAWNSEIAGPNDQFDPITTGLAADAPPQRRNPLTLTDKGGVLTCPVELPTVARALPVLGTCATLGLHVIDREADNAGCNSNGRDVTGGAR